MCVCVCVVLAHGELLSSAQNHLAQMTEIRYVALPICPSPSLFKCRSKGSRLAPPTVPGFEP